MKKYYEGHDDVYQRIQAEGHNCWGRINFEQAHMQGFVKKALKKTNLDSRPHVQALVLGCGTGPIACLLSKRGYQVSGIDISPTAIEMAKQQAEQRSLDIKYWVHDLCQNSLGNQQYDLILDSHCLHCIVSEKDRKSALKHIRNALNPDGVFILETMMGRIHTKDVQSDKDGIVWTPFGETPPFFEPRIQKNGLWFVPQRLIRPNKSVLEEELKTAGFSIVWSQTVPPEKDDENGDYQAICEVTYIETKNSV